MSFKFALEQYIKNPSHDAVLYHDDTVVIIKDMYPKSIRHYLIIPRNITISKQHPLTVFQDNPEVYEDMAVYVKKAKQMIVDDLIENKVVSFTKHDNVEYDTFVNTFIRAGVHSIPSLNNLHIHVITQDFYLDRMKHKKHYNSFTTRFFVDFEVLAPVRPDSDSDASETENYPSAKISDPANIIKNTPLTCTYCGKKFGNKFKELKMHLEKEYMAKFLS